MYHFTDDGSVFEGDLATSAHVDVQTSRNHTYRDELMQQMQEKRNKEFIQKYEDRTLDDMHLNTLGTMRAQSRGGGGAPLRDQFGNVVAGRSPDRSNKFLRSNIGTPNSSQGRSNIGTPMIVNTGNGVSTINAQNPFIIPGVSPTPTSIVYTNYPQFGDGQPISGQALIMPGGQPFVPSPSAVLNGTQSLPNIHLGNVNTLASVEQSPVRQGIPDFIQVGSGGIPGTSYGLTNAQYLEYLKAKEENDALTELKYDKYNKLYPDWALDDIHRSRYFHKDHSYPKSPYRGRNWYNDDPYWWDDYYWGGRLGSRYGTRFGRRRSRRGKWYGNRYDDDYYYNRHYEGYYGDHYGDYYDRYYDKHYDPYYKGYGRNDWYWWNRSNTYKGKRDPNAKSGDYGHWYNIPDEKDRPPAYFDLPPPWIKHQDWNPYLWRRDKPPPFWMYGKDKKRHWEFKKEWERWYKGESKDWWNKFVPDDFKGKVEDLVNEKIKKVSNDLTEKERALYDEIKTLKNTTRSDDVQKKRYLEEIQRLKNKVKEKETEEDLRHNYVYQILFENWKKNNKSVSPYHSKDMKLPDLTKEDRGRNQEWLEIDEKMEFPSAEEIERMNISDNFFDVDRFHELNVSRLKKLPKKEKGQKQEQKFDVNTLDDDLFGKLDSDVQMQENDSIEVKPMYSSPEKKQDEYGERKIYANSLKSNGEFDSTFARDTDQGFVDMKNSVRFRGSNVRNNSVFNRDGDRSSKYQSPLKIASKMLTS
ncbi:unnamed protein product [Moneuplotes crassus]|uniref:Uncharacterized protein n=1 Tax=Euplotes crassus TaxID=5936 RepID=A0AAD2DC76_EUPCR|nr:unnamed protein product [Moneuplotes crassus]